MLINSWESSSHGIGYMGLYLYGLCLNYHSKSNYQVVIYYGLVLEYQFSRQA